jgi:hypothetical protein
LVLADHLPQPGDGIKGQLEAVTIRAARGVHDVAELGAARAELMRD